MACNFTNEDSVWLYTSAKTGVTLVQTVDSRRKSDTWVAAVCSDDTSDIYYDRMGERWYCSGCKKTMKGVPEEAANSRLHFTSPDHNVYSCAMWVARWTGSEHHQVTFDVAHW